MRHFWEIVIVCCTFSEAEKVSEVILVGYITDF